MLQTQKLLTEIQAFQPDNNGTVSAKQKRENKLCNFN
jgi:hypothetical protein